MRSTIEAVDEYPHSGYPRGWFQIGWCDEFAEGVAVPMTYFGRSLVAYRGESGVVHVFDAHCPHLGAHLGYGGIIEGDCIRCPFHGWKYDAEGFNIDIPYSTKTYGRVGLRKWHTCEIGSLVLVWYDDAGREPMWDPPLIPELDDPDTYRVYPGFTHIWRGLKIRPQYIVENTVDIAHQTWVHHSPSEHRLVDWEINDHMCRSRQSLTFGAGKEKTWLTPNGPVEAVLDVECWGVGFNVARFIGTDDSAHVASHTPIDELHIDERLTVIMKPEPGYEDSPSEGAIKRFKFEVKQFEFDVTVWENMRYVARPPWVPEEGQVFREFRQWVGTFYEPLTR